MEEIIKFISQIDVPNLLVIGIMFWFGYDRLDRKIDRLDKKIDVCEKSLGARIEASEKSLGARIEASEKSLGARIDKLQETVTDIDRRLCRLEGAFHSKECCLLKSETQHKAAE